MGGTLEAVSGGCVVGVDMGDSAAMNEGSRLFWVSLAASWQQTGRDSCCRQPLNADAMLVLCCAMPTCLLWYAVAIAVCPQPMVLLFDQTGGCDQHS